MVDESGKNLARMPRSVEGEVIAPLTKSEIVERLRGAVDKAQGDSYERAKVMYGNMTEEELDRPSVVGIVMPGGKVLTNRDVWESAKKGHAEHQQILDFLDSLLEE